MRQGIRAVAAAAVCAVATAAMSSNALADQNTLKKLPTPGQMATLKPAEITLYESGLPVDILLDPSTDDILSITAANAVVTPSITIRNVCDAGDGCYQTNQAPYADEGFYGSAGTHTGSWPDRSGYSAGSYTVSACWTGNCGPEIAAGSKVTFTSDVTGTSFTIY